MRRDGGYALAMSYGGPPPQNPYTPPPYGGYGGPTPPGGQGPYGAGPTAPFGQGGFTPPPQQSFFARHPFLAIRLGIAAVVIPIAIGVGVFAAYQGSKNKVLLDCGPTAAHVFVDGKDVAEVAAGSHKVVEVPSGSHTIEAKDASGKTLEKATMNVSSSHFRGIFRFGKAKPIVLVSEIYGHAPDPIVKATPIIKEIPDGAFSVPGSEADLDTLDTAFVDSIQMGQHEQYRIVWKLCHENRGKRGPARVGCPHAPIPDDD
jgi:hypothetical protein